MICSLSSGDNYVIWGLCFSLTLLIPWLRFTSSYSFISSLSYIHEYDKYSHTSIIYSDDFIIYDTFSSLMVVNRLDSPLPAAFDRVLQVMYVINFYNPNILCSYTNRIQASHNHSLQFGDASGIQSPVSFGGFGSLTRHLKRLSTGILYV